MEKGIESHGKVMEKSWKSHGISLRHSCGNPAINHIITNIDGTFF